MISLNSALQIWQTFYCDGRHDTCQRFQRSSQGQSVPPNLLPNGKSLDLVDVPAPAAKPAPRPAGPSVSTDNISAPRAAASPAPAMSAGSVYSYYLRIRVRETADNVVERVTQEIRAVGIGVDAAVLKPVQPDGTRCLIILTDQGSDVDLFRAVLSIESLDGVTAKVKSISLEKMDALNAA
jgi:hypothetical protein